MKNTANQITCCVHRNNGVNVKNNKILKIGWNVGEYRDATCNKIK